MPPRATQPASRYSYINDHHFPRFQNLKSPSTTSPRAYCRDLTSLCLRLCTLVKLMLNQPRRPRTEPIQRGLAFLQTGLQIFGVEECRRPGKLAPCDRGAPCQPLHRRLCHVLALVKGQSARRLCLAYDAHSRDASVAASAAAVFLLTPFADESTPLNVTLAVQVGGQSDLPS